MKLPFISSGDNNIEKPKQLSGFAGRILNPKIIIPAFAVFIVLLAAVSVVVVLQEKKPTQPVAAESTTANEVAAALAVLDQFDSDFLISFADRDEATIGMLAIVHINSETCEASVLYVPPTGKTDVNNLNGTILDHYIQGGINELVWAVGEYTGRSIDRYIVADDDAFLSFAKGLGDVELEIDENINHSYKGVSYIIEKGKQKLTADTLFKYYAYLCDSLYSGGEQKLTELLSYLITEVLCPEGDSKIETQYKNIVDNLQTNISAKDVSSYGGAAVSYVEKNNAVKIVSEGFFEG